MKDLERKFLAAMRDLYIRADKECNYRATRFLQMLSEQGGVATAINLVTKTGGTEGFERLWELGRLDLSVEALVLKNEYRELFSEEVISACRDRLQQYGYYLKQEIEKKLFRCLKLLCEYDYVLICNDVSERAITHKLAEYLQKEFPDYNVDCEYNRNFEAGPRRPKYVDIIYSEVCRKYMGLINNDDIDTLDTISAYPDIIVHRRRKNSANLLVVEVKKDISRSDHEYDLSKLRAFTSPADGNMYNYQFGIFIQIPINFYKDKECNPLDFMEFRDLCTICWFQKGRKT